MILKIYYILECFEKSKKLFELKLQKGVVCARWAIACKLLKKQKEFGKCAGEDFGSKYKEFHVKDMQWR